MSIKEDKVDDESWITFVSPLVRIVERTENSQSSPTTHSGDQHHSHPSSVSPNVSHAGTSSDTVSSGTPNYPDGSIDLSNASQDMGNLPSW
jgi:hypothetical protein